MDAGLDPRALRIFAVPARQQQAAECHNSKEKSTMESALIFAFVVVAGAPLIGIWRGHVWAKGNGKVLRKTAASERNLAA